eukprot:3928142-Alexandrium_andersonii.AAC.1
MVLSDSDVLAQLQIVGPRGSDPAAIAARIDHANMLVRFLVDFIAQRSWSMSLHSSCCPDAFAILFHKTPTVVDRGVAWLRDLWDTLLACESAAERKVARVLADVHYNTWQLPRELY